MIIPDMSKMVSMIDIRHAPVHVLCKWSSVKVLFPRSAGEAQQQHVRNVLSCWSGAWLLCLSATSTPESKK